MNPEQLLQRIEDIEVRLAKLEQRHQVSVAPRKQPVAKVIAQPDVSPPISPKVKVPHEVVPQEDVQSIAIRVASQRPPKPARINLEQLVGGNLLNKVGILAIFVGVGLFFKLAVDSGWINEIMRIVIGFVAGLGLLVAGIVTYKNNYRKFSATLLGGGVGVLYFTIYAGYAFYHLFAVHVTFGLLTLVTITGTLLSLLTHQPSLAVLCQIGGFLSPLMLNTAEDRHRFLFSYLGLLNVGMLYISYKKSWRVLERIGMVATAGIFWLWADQYYTETKLGSALFFATIFYLLFYFVPIARIILRRLAASAWDIFGLVSTSSAYFFTCYIILEDSYPQGVKILGLGLAILQAATAWFVQRHTPEGEKSLATKAAYIMAGLFFTFFLWNAFALTTLTMLLTLWAGVLGWLLVHKKITSLTLAFGFLQAWVILRLMILHADVGAQASVLFNERVLTYGLQGSVLFLLAYCGRIISYRNVCFLLGAGLLITMIGCEAAGIMNRELHAFPWKLYLHAPLTKEYVPLVNAHFALWLTSSGLLFLFSRLFAKRVNPSHEIARSCFVLSWIGMFFALAPEIAGLLSPSIGSAPRLYFLLSLKIPLSEYEFLWNGRTLFLLSYAAWFLFLPSLEAKMSGTASEPALRRLASIAVAFLGLFLVSSEAMGFVSSHIGCNPLSIVEGNIVGTATHTALTAVWVFYGLICLAFGVRKQNSDLRYFALALFGATALKVVFIDLSHLQAIWRVLSFLVMGVIFLAASWLYHRFVIGKEGKTHSPATKESTLFRKDSGSIDGK